MKSLLYTKPQPHSCELERLAEAEKVQDVKTKKTELKNQLVPQLLSLTYICAALQDKKPYLETRELINPPNYFVESLMNQSINEFRENYDQKPYLRCWVDGKQVNCNPVNIDRMTAGEKHWVNRAIDECVKSGESSFELNINELTDFLRTTKGTLGVLTTDIGESARDFLMHISFKAK
jgi:hypothetical protein